MKTTSSSKPKHQQTTLQLSQSNKLALFLPMKTDYKINGVKPINNDELTTYNVSELNGTDINKKKQPHRFKEGNQFAKGNHKPRTRLSDRFLKDLVALWESHGNQALEAMLTEKPAAFCQMVANLLPKHIDIESSDGVNWVINAQPLKDLSESEWREQHGLLIESDT